MRPEDIPEILPASAPDPVLVERIAASLARDAAPVRPLASTGTIVSGLLLLFVAVSVSGAAKLGYFGVHRLSAGAISLIFPALGGLALLAAAAAVNAVTPGSKRPFHPTALMAAGCIAMAAVFVLLFRDYTLGRFVPQGVSCLKAGLLWALPAGLLTWLVLRRGYAVDRGAAGLGAGTFAGLAGLAVLELHCPNFRLWHVVVWHLAVVPLSALAAWIVYRFGSKRSAAELMQ